MNRASTSIFTNQAGDVVIRLYTRWRQDGSEYYEVTMPPKDAMQLGLELLNEGDKAGYFQERRAGVPLE